MKEKYHVRRTDLVLPDLSFKINGVLYEVFRQLGGGHLERYYQKAVGCGLKTAGISFVEQQYVPLKFNNTLVGKYFLDFLIDKKVVLELKRGKFVSSMIINQVKQYLIALDLQLALIACFTQNGVLVKRIVNIKSKNIS